MSEYRPPIGKVSTGRKIYQKLCRVPVLGKILRAVYVLHKHGLVMSCRRLAYHLKVRNFYISPRTRRIQQNTRFERDVKFSVLVPLYNTPIRYLRSMIRSVQRQTYPNWELCLADGSDESHANVGTVCRALGAKDGRIKYRKLERNTGISGNSNAAMAMATGDYYALLDHDDLLHDSALFCVAEAIRDEGADFIFTDECKFKGSPLHITSTNFKPCYAPDTLRIANYICHLTVFDKNLLAPAGGGFRSEYDGSQDHDIILRLTEQARHITHIQRLLYWWRICPGSVATSIEAKPYAVNAAKAAIAAHLARLGLRGEVLGSGIHKTRYRIRYEIAGQPRISILIPTCDHWEMLRRCVDSVLEKSTYKNYEIILIENNSRDPETFAYYETLKDIPNIRVVTYEGSFNYSAINNFGYRFAHGEHILLLNNDIEVLSPDWLQEMLMFSQRADVGAVGAKLYFPSGKIQHGGVVTGKYQVAAHLYRGSIPNSTGYRGGLITQRNMNAVTGACLMTRREVWEQVGGLDENLPVDFNDVDYCTAVRNAGYLVVWTPYSELIHYESESRGLNTTPEKNAIVRRATEYYMKKWAADVAKGDPYYNPQSMLAFRFYSFPPKEQKA